MSKQTEAMKLALEAMRGVIAWHIMRNHMVPYRVRDPLQEAITAISEALAEQPAQQEPVAWPLLLVGAHNGLVGKAGDKFVGHPKHYERVDVYTSPPAQRKPLTGEEMNQIEARWDASMHGSKIAFVIRETEAAHGIKENT